MKGRTSHRSIVCPLRQNPSSLVPVCAEGRRHVGMMLGPPKTEGAKGRHLLTPVVVDLLRRRREAQAQERQRAGAALAGNRLRGSADRAGLHHDDRRTSPAPGRHQGGCHRGPQRPGIDPTGLGTHAGRSTAITVLYAEEGLDLADIARHVGHAALRRQRLAYVRHLGRRPRTTVVVASRLLDPTGFDPDQAGTGVRPLIYE